jgi:hypothetical protein
LWSWADLKIRNVNLSKIRLIMSKLVAIQKIKISSSTKIVRQPNFLTQFDQFIVSHKTEYFL